MLPVAVRKIPNNPDWLKIVWSALLVGLSHVDKVNWLLNVDCMPLPRSSDCAPLSVNEGLFRRSLALAVTLGQVGTQRRLVDATPLLVKLLLPWVSNPVWSNGSSASRTVPLTAKISPLFLP